MLKQRVMTALCLVPIVLAGIYYSSWQALVVVMGVITLACSWEWGQFIPLTTHRSRILLMSIQACLLGLAFYYLTPIGLMAYLPVWGLIIIAIIFYPKSSKCWAHWWLVLPLGLLVLTAFHYSLAKLLMLDEGKELFLYLLFLIWAADSGAYVLGKLCGKHKLIPEVSPGKTIDGLFGGILASMLVMLIGYWYFNPFGKLAWFAGGVVLVIISVFGDLFISMLKRQANLKDSGHLLPGHGGALDRLDSLIATSPFFYLGIYYFMGYG